MEKHLVLLLSASFTLSLCAVIGQNYEKENPQNFNSTTPPNSTNKDMYLIHATVYEVGILTNSSDRNDSGNYTTPMGTQESLVFYHKNGTSIDLSDIPQPLLTNVTGETFVGVAPVIRKPRSAKHFDDSAPQDDSILNDEMFYSGSDEYSNRHTRQAHQESDEFQQDGSSNEESNEQFADEQLDSPKESYAQWFVRDKNQKSTDDDKTVRMVHGSSVIPEEASVSSVGLPPLVRLNSALTTIPVPIPNTSVVHYAKVTTMIMPANTTKTPEKS